MLYKFTCSKCGNESLVTKDVFDKFLDEELLAKAEELVAEPDVKMLRLNFEDGCIRCKPNPIKRHEVKLYATRDKSTRSPK